MLSPFSCSPYFFLWLFFGILNFFFGGEGFSSQDEWHPEHIDFEERKRFEMLIPKASQLKWYFFEKSKNIFCLKSDYFRKLNWLKIKCISLIFWIKRNNLRIFIWRLFSLIFWKVTESFRLVHLLAKNKCTSVVNRNLFFFNYCALLSQNILIGFS